MIVVPVKSESYLHGVADDKTNPAPTHHPAEPAVSVHRVAMDDDEEDLDIENDADDEDDGAGIDMESSHGGSSSAASPAPTPEQGGGGSRGGAGRPGFSIADILQPGFGGNGGTGPAGKRSPSPPPIIRKPIASVLSPNSLNFSIYSLFSGGGNKATAALLRGDKTPTATAKEEPISPPPPPATRLPPHPPVHPLMRPLCYAPPIPPPHAAALSPTDALALHQLPGFQPHHHHHPRFLLASHLQPAAHHPDVRRTPPPPAQHPVDYTVPAVASRQRSTPAAFPALTPSRRDVVTPDAAATHNPAISKANTTAKRSLPNHVKHHQDSVNKRHCSSGGRGDANAANPPPASSSSPGVKSPSGAAAPVAGQQQNLWPAWVYCTRYSDRPSSGPRTRKVRRKEKRVTSCSSVTSGDDKRPRTAFTADQLGALKREFEENRYLTEERRQRLARDLALSDSQVKIWFQNKRAKMKKASGLRNPLALQLMAQGLYNHSTVPLSDDEDADSPGAHAGGLGGGGGSD